MKKEKKGIILILGILTVLFVGLLGISFSVRSMVVEMVSGSEFSEDISLYIVETIEDTWGGADAEQLQIVHEYMTENEAIQQMTGKILDAVVKCVKHQKSYEDIDLSEEVNELVEQTYQYIEESELAWDEDMLKAFKDNIQEQKDEIEDSMNLYAGIICEQIGESHEGVALVKTYSVLKSAVLKCILLLLTVGLLVLQVRFSASISNVLIYVGAESLVVAIIYLFVRKFMKNLAINMLDMSLDTGSIVGICIALFVIGIAAIAGGILLKKMKNKTSRV